MKEFVLIFRNSHHPDFKPSPEQMQEVMTTRMNWMGSICCLHKIIRHQDDYNELLTVPQQPVNNNKNEYGAYTAAAPFIGTVSG